MALKAEDISQRTLSCYSLPWAWKILVIQLFWKGLLRSIWWYKCISKLAGPSLKYLYWYQHSILLYVRLLIVILYIFLVPLGYELWIPMQKAAMLQLRFTPLTKNTKNTYFALILNCCVLQMQCKVEKNFETMPNFENNYPHETEFFAANFY